MAAGKRLLDLWLAHRKRFAPLVAVTAVVMIGSVLFDGWQKGVDIRYDLGADHESFTEVRLSYQLSGESVKEARFEYPEGAPESFRHSVELSSGRYDIEASLRGPEASRDISRAIEVPAEGLVRIDLYDVAYAVLPWGAPR